jgi:hypothetical protein
MNGHAKEEIAQEISREEDTQTHECTYFSAREPGFPECEKIKRWD